VSGELCASFCALLTSALRIFSFTLLQNIVVNPGLAKAMHAQSGAEREKRARIIESEGERTSIQNYSEGKTTS
jgi:regulator of protease activity HflC (stomatin/prohibitin superfamily)